MIAWHERRYSLRLARAIETLTGKYPTIFHEDDTRRNSWLGVECSALSNAQLDAIELALDNGERADKMTIGKVNRYARH